MPRPRKSVPSYSLHAPTGQAFVRFSDGNGGRTTVYLGQHNSPDSLAEYARIVAELAGARSTRAAAGTGEPRADLTLNELLLAFMRYAGTHYRRADDSPTDELAQYRQTFRLVRELYGHRPVAEFGPRALKAVRQKMIDAGWCRKLINQRVGRVKRAFKWAASEELIPDPVFQALRSVDRLQAGRTPARDRAPVAPVDAAVVDRTVAFLNRHVAGLVEFQRLTGCRPGEACKLRRCDIDTSGPQWRFRPPAHKTAHRGKTRTVTIGPKAQALLATFPTADPVEYVFGPARAVAEFRAARAAARKTPRYPSHVARNAGVRKSAPKRAPGARYKVTSYEMAVARACKRAGVPRWAPNQLRHTFATAVRKGHGLEAAQILLGHERASTTEIYAEKNQGLADKVVGEIG